MIFDDPYNNTFAQLGIEIFQRYKQDPSFIKSLFEKFTSPLTSMDEFYRIMVRRKEIIPIEQSDQKERFWKEALTYETTREKRIMIAKSLYLFELLNEKDAH